MKLTPEPINPEAIQAEAQKAAWIYSEINAACPYPFGSMAATLFREAFEKALEIMSYGQTGAASAMSILAELEKDGKLARIASAVKT